MSRHTSYFLNCDSARAPVAAIGQLQLPILDGAFPRARCLVWITGMLLMLLALIQLTSGPV
jgi:hypothetical protein